MEMKFAVTDAIAYTPKDDLSLAGCALVKKLLDTCFDLMSYVQTHVGRSTLACRTYEHTSRVHHWPARRTNTHTLVPATSYRQHILASE